MTVKTMFAVTSILMAVTMTLVLLLDFGIIKPAGNPTAAITQMLVMDVGVMLMTIGIKLFWE
jgi:hypothetical protein